MQSYSESVNNFDIRGFRQQPVLVIPKEYLSSTRLKSYYETVAGSSDYVDDVPAVGVYLYTNEPKPSSKPILFSLNNQLFKFAYVLSNYSTENRKMEIGNDLNTQIKYPENFTVMFTDLALIARDQIYRMGFVVQTNRSGVIEYVFKPGKTDVHTKSSYSAIFFGQHVYVGLPVFLLGVLCVTLIRCCCKLETESHIHIKSTQTSEEEPTAQGYWRTTLHAIKRFFFIRGEEIVEHGGTDSYYYLRFSKLLLWYVVIAGIVSMIVLLPVHFLAGELDFSDYSSSTISALSWNSGFRYFNAVLQCLYIIGGFVLIFFALTSILSKRHLLLSQYSVFQALPKQLMCTRLKLLGLDPQQQPRSMS